MLVPEVFFQEEGGAPVLDKIDPKRGGLVCSLCGLKYLRLNFPVLCILHIFNVLIVV